MKNKKIIIICEALLISELIFIILAFSVIMGIISKIVGGLVITSATISWVICLFMIIALIVLLVPVALVAFIIEKINLIYTCKNCNHEHYITLKQVILSPHIGWKKYIKCPNCNKRSWNEAKVIDNKENN